MSDRSNNKKIEAEQSVIFTAFFKLILSLDKKNSSEIISDNKLKNGRKK